MLPSNDYLTTEQLSEMIGVATATLENWRWKDRGEGPRWIKMGAAVRYLRSDVEAWIEENRKGGLASDLDAPAAR